ncbi:sulfate transport system substrate-binding protein [Plasticicumulans lactativorans]|uniref:Sulfate transport system substrate-binding protein n=1 Tax=Plasticicumulans lactativorans TaxID=1133106 RepID=A0A4R2L5F6_9GAMM|nr:sulfate ABC transporter substrate-binding protein [Plasticicumulans lactativorans]TCO81042.1 sulfate transport system substrate-binding protein [Plasticicumulans lactativorans]
MSLPLHARSLGLLAVLAASAPALAADASLLNASYDVAREFYKDFNAQFEPAWKARTGATVTINQSHGGSSKQARAVIDGLAADVVTMNQQTDIDAIAAAGLIAPDWRTRLPYGAAPYASTIVFLVRKGNPKGIHDWDDLVRDGVQLVIPNPKTSGNGRYSYLGAWAYAQEKYASAEQAQAFVGKLFHNVPVLDAGGRAATTTFAQRGIGDVLLTFESEVLQIAKEFNTTDFETVVPSLSVDADAPVAVVDRVVDKRGSRALAEAYLQALFTPDGQRLAARHYLRPRDPAILAEFRDRFAPIRLVTVDQAFGGWARAQAEHFADGGRFDQIYAGAK